MNQVPPVDRRKWLERLQRRLDQGVFVQTLVDSSVAFFLVAGATCLAVKLFLPQWWPGVAWGLLAYPVLVAVVWAMSRARRFTGAQSVALLDHRLGGGGLLMTLAEQPDEQWATRLSEAELHWQRTLPAWRTQRAARRLAVPLVFFVAASLIPPRTVSSLIVQPSAVSATEVARLNEMLEELSEKEVVDEEKREELEREIQKLAEETRFRPLTHEDWETVDALQRKMELELTSRENELQRLASALSAASELLAQNEMRPDAARESVEALLNEAGLQDLAQLGEMAKNGSEAAGKEGKAGDGSGFRLPDDPDALQAALADLADHLERELRAVRQGNGCPDCNKPGGT